MKYKLTKKTISEIGHELGASYVVEGSVRRSGTRVRVTAQLIQVVDLIELRAEPVFDSIRPDPRFIDLMRRVGWR